MDGKRIVFDSNGDLVPGENPEGNRELFLARLRRGGIEITQITHTGAGIDNRSGSLDGHSVVVAFSSNGDFTGQNADGNREIFTWHRKTERLRADHQLAERRERQPGDQSDAALRGVRVDRRPDAERRDQPAHLPVRPRARAR